MTGDFAAVRRQLLELHAGRDFATALEVIEGLGHDYPTDFAQRLPATVEWALPAPRPSLTAKLPTVDG